MTDVHDKNIRSFNMSQIKAKNTKPELLVRKFLHSNGFRYNLYDKKLPGRPDIVLNKYKTIIDIRGCFWHLHEGCKYGSQVITPSEIINSKRKSAVLRDQTNMIKWIDQGWNVIVVWSDCELEPRKKISEVRVKRLNEILNSLNK